VISFSRTLKFIMCVPDPKKCIYVDKSVTMKCYRSHFPSLFDRQNVKHCVHNWWIK
jgi:hypothetical protein